MVFDKRSSKSRVALVTGAAGLTGSSVVRRLSADGWKVAGIDLKENSAELPLRVDVTDRSAMMAAAAQVAEKLGPIELLVTATGDYEQVPIGEMDLKRWQKMLDIWLGGATNACAASVPQMLEAGKGSVILLSADLRPGGTGLSYAAAASGAVVAFAKSFGCEVAPQGVRVNCLAPPAAVNPDWIAETVSFLSNEGDYYAGQVFFLCSDVKKEKGDM